MDYTKILISHNLKSSYPRIRILEYLDANRIHPTVEDIYVALVKEIPSLSRTTVYNTLKTFADSGIVRILNVDNRYTRFDFCVENHGHFICSGCGNVFDFILNSDFSECDELKGFRVDEKNVYFSGYCKECAENKI